MAAFLPSTTSAAQQVLTDQVSHGAASHLILVALEGAPAPILAILSGVVASNLRKHPGFIDVANGDEESSASVQDFVWRNRYLLAPDLTADRFTVAGLHAALVNDVELLRSDLGAVIQPSLPADPTNEALRLLSSLGRTQGPRSQHGVWFSADGNRALLVIHTQAAGFDIDAQQRNLAVINGAFDRARAVVAGAEEARVLETGPGVFAVRTRDMTRHDVTRLSLLAFFTAASLVAFAYRSPRALVLGLLPVASGLFAATAATSLAFGFIHGVTLGFGATLIGESVDYAIYLLTQTARGESPSNALARIWPTLRLGALASIVGFTIMLFSSFVGFTQLGLFSIIGLVAAACVTRFVLPHIMSDDFFAAGADTLAKPLLAVMRHRRFTRMMVLIVVFGGAATLAAHGGGFWDENLADLSPIPATDQALEQALRRELGLGDIRYFVVFPASSEQQALEQGQTLAIALGQLKNEHALGGFDIPSAILPSDAMQRLRQAALPDTQTLRARLDQALTGLPFRPDAFDPFLHDVAAARSAPLLTRASLPRALALELDSTLVRSRGGWTMVVPLRDVRDLGHVSAALAATPTPKVTLVDLEHESDRLLHRFEQEATVLAVVGSLAILVLLVIVLRSLTRAGTVAAPLVASVVVTAALLTMGGGKLSIFMVIGFLLIVAVGSNYCLFFERPEQDIQMKRRLVASIVLANLCTVSAYGFLAISEIPVLHDIDMTVAIGAFLTLLFASALIARDASSLPSVRRDRETTGIVSVMDA